MAVQVEDMLSFKFKNSMVVAFGSSGAGKTYTIEVCLCAFVRERTLLL